MWHSQPQLLACQSSSPSSTAQYSPPLATTKLDIKSLTWLHKFLSSVWLCAPLRHLKSLWFKTLLLFAGPAATPAFPPLQWSHQHGGLQHPRQEDSHRGLQWPDAADSRWETAHGHWSLTSSDGRRARPGPQCGARGRSGSPPDPGPAGARGLQRSPGRGQWEVFQHRPKAVQYIGLHVATSSHQYW